MSFYQLITQINYFNLLIIKLVAKQDVVITIISTFSFTMLGFLVAALAVIVSLSHKPHIKSYKHYGYFSVFGQVYCFSLICLLITFCLSLLGIIISEVMPLIITSTFINLMQISLISVASYKLMIKA